MNQRILNLKNGTRIFIKKIYLQKVVNINDIIFYTQRVIIL